MLLLLFFHFFSSCLASDPSLNIIPYPSDVSLGTGITKLDEKFTIIVSTCHADCDVLQRGVERYMNIIFQPIGSTGMVFRQSIFEDRVNASAPQGDEMTVRVLQVITTDLESVTLELGVDESYVLDIPGDDAQVATLTASNTWGALKGLESFAQLVEYRQSDEKRDGSLIINWTPLTIHDSPRYPWRGLMIDTARHFLTVSLIEKTLDTMASMKMNVLHWHIVDAESFPFASDKFSELKSKSTYHPKASYSKADISHLVSYARDRGVRIVPEFDTPGHTASIGQAYPELIADCYDWLKSTNEGELRWPIFNNIALDVTRSETKVFVKSMVQEMATAFPDDYFHIGGDEVDQDCWNAVPSILTWMQQNGYAEYNETCQEWSYDFTALQGSWTSFVQEVTSMYKKKAVVWEESFTLGFDLSADTIVQIWLPDDGTDVLKRIIESGHKVILSNGWYLDRQAPTCTIDVGDCPVHWMWIWTGRDMYDVEPLDPTSTGWTPTDEQAELILGGEAASWGESVDDKNFDARVWSRVPGVAERLWSPRSYNDDWEIQPRLSVIACQLARRGVTLADTQPAFCDYYPTL